MWCPHVYVHAYLHTYVRTYICVGGAGVYEVLECVSEEATAAGVCCHLPEAAKSGDVQ